MSDIRNASVEQLITDRTFPRHILPVY